MSTTLKTFDSSNQVWKVAMILKPCAIIVRISVRADTFSSEFCKTNSFVSIKATSFQFVNGVCVCLPSIGKQTHWSPHNKRINNLCHAITLIPCPKKVVTPLDPLHFVCLAKDTSLHCKGKGGPWRSDSRKTNQIFREVSVACCSANKRARMMRKGWSLRHGNSHLCEVYE